ncbi:MAG TPA: TerC family protein [Bacteroidia bacterium]|jgi:predicted tellurium resistance membrane protein TerC|nr:TerC family protein [Bacteroidia bacterium]
MHDFGRDWADLFHTGALVSLLTLTVLEIVLGVDNIIFISIVAGKLPREQQPKARATGLFLALLFRIALLISITWILGLQKPLFTIAGFGATGRDLILFGGGFFLLFKTLGEINERLKGRDEDPSLNLKKISLNAIIAQIVFIDIVFSFDSILTAVSIVSNVLVMIGAVILAMLLMLAFSGKVSDFINRNPTIKMLALAFLLMVGIILVLDASHFNVAIIKPYIYCSMGFAFFVEMLNMRERSNRKSTKREDNKTAETIKNG